MPGITTEELAQLLYGDPAPQGEAGTGAPFQLGMPAPEATLAPVGQYAGPAAAGNFAPRTVEYDAYGNASSAPGSGTPVLPPGVGKFGAKIKTNDSGYSPEKMAQIEAGPMGSKQMGKKKLSAEQKIRGDYSQSLGMLNDSYAAEGQATKAAGDAEAQRIMAEAGHMGKLSRIQQQHADSMKALSMDAALAAQQAKDEYRAKLLAVGELNPNALWDEAGKEGQFAMGVAAFVHDMLGVKGIKTSAMDTINQAIKNKIDAQIYNINTQKQVAQGFKDLYDMTVQESATQMEVQAKLHGYYLKAVETGIKAQMGQYDSNVARTKMQLALTAVRKEQAKANFEVEKQIHSNLDQEYQREIQIRGQNLQASIAKANRENEMNIAKLKSQKTHAPLYVFDGETGKGVLRVRDGVPEPMQKDVLEKASKFYAADKEMLKLRELERKLDPQFDGFVGTRFSKEDARIYDATTKRLAHSMLAAMGERATDKDVKEFLSSLPMPTDFTRGGVSRVLADTHLHMHDELDGLMLQTVEDVPENEQPQGPKNKLFAGSGADAKLGTLGPQPDSRSETLVKIAKAPDSMARLEEYSDIAKKTEYSSFTEPFWKDFKRSRPDIDIANKDLAKLHGKDTSRPPKAFEALRELAEDAFHNNPQARADLEALTKVAPEDEGGSSVEVRAMAKYFLEKLDSPAAKVPGVEGQGFGIETETAGNESSAPSEPPPTMESEMKNITSKVYGK